VQYDDFVSSVQTRGGRPRDETETLVHATLRVLAERLTAGEADDLRAQLPGDLQADLIPPEPEAQPFGPDEFTRRVARMARLPEAERGRGWSPCSPRPATRSSRASSTTCCPSWAGSSPGSCPDRGRSDGGVPDTNGSAAHAGRPESFPLRSVQMSGAAVHPPAAFSPKGSCRSAVRRASRPREAHCVTTGIEPNWMEEL
jgi:hypothetical protein